MCNFKNSFVLATLENYFVLRVGKNFDILTGKIFVFWDFGIGVQVLQQREDVLHLRVYIYMYIALRRLQGALRLRFHIELHTRKSFRSGFERGRGTSLIWIWGVEYLCLSRFLVFFTAYASVTDAPAFSNTFSREQSLICPRL